MRWIFISLLLVNAAVFIWYSVESSQQERIASLNTSSTDAGVISGAPLTLVSELTEEERLALRNKVKPEIAKPLEVILPVAVPEAEQTKSLSSADQPVPDTSANPPIAVASKPLEPNHCMVLGPVAIKQVEQLSQRLLAVGIISESIDIDVKGAPEYWVVLPPFLDDKQALQKLQELQGRGVKAQIVPSGPLANSISFGLFGQKTEADQLAETVKAKGYRAEVKAVPVTRKEKWLSLSERQSPKVNDQLWLEIQQDFPKLEKRIKSCN